MKIHNLIQGTPEWKSFEAKNGFVINGTDA